jgi:hypothetical protein
MIAPASRVLMVRPRSFQPNFETAATNAFQKNVGISNQDITVQALREFDQFKSELENHDIEVVSHDEPIDAKTPDAVFPNNWFAVLPNGQVFLFPMCAPNRRREVNPAWITPYVRSKSLVDLRYFCEKGIFLEGTGSLILDHDNKSGYACLSERTQVLAIKEFERQSGYQIFHFVATDRHGVPFYHTNVMMALGLKTAVVCLESISSASERAKLCEMLAATGHEIVAISQEQVLQFAGNMLFLSNQSGKCYWVCSEAAFQCLTELQRKILQKDGDFITSSLPTIEAVGGGSARCMLGELF